jgi:hypothetical protein
MPLVDGISAPSRTVLEQSKSGAAAVTQPVHELIQGKRTNGVRFHHLQDDKSEEITFPVRIRWVLSIQNTAAKATASCCA